MQISQGIHQIPGIVANVFLIVEPDGLTLIDCGLPRSTAKILGYVQSLGRQAREIKRILITHADNDHYGSLAELQAATGAQVYASAVEAQAIAHGEMSRPLKLSAALRAVFALSRPFLRAKPCRVQHTVKNDQCLNHLGMLKVIETPGHTPGHISFYAPSQGILFAGDSLRSAEGRLLVSSGVNTWDEAIARDSARKQAALHPRIVCVGHGAAVYNAAEKFPEV
ncbi:MAG: MBL fold metallo-hydrolase [Anaerolineales bacterium]